MSDVLKKRCTGPCGKEYPATEEYFYRHRECKYGVNSRCKKCMHARKEKSPEGYKRCAGTCGQEYPATTEYFHSRKEGRGLRSRCIECINAARRKPLVVIDVTEKRRNMHFAFSQEVLKSRSLIAREILGLNGDPYTQEVIDRFLLKTEVDENGCWGWRGAIGSNGYAQICMYKKTIPAHRWTYILFKGAIPDGLQLDHLCRDRSCVNPDHLEVVTGKENVLRGVSFAAINARKTHCIRGHAFSEENTYIAPGGGRYCRTCRSEKDRQRNSRRRLRKDERLFNSAIAYSSL